MSNKISAKEVIAFIFQSIRPFKMAMFMIIITAIIGAVDISLRPYILKIIVDRLAIANSADTLGSIGALLFLYLLINFIVIATFRCYNYFVGIKAIPNLRTNLALKGFEALLKQDFSYFQNNFSGALSNKIKDITNAIPDIVENSSEQFLFRALALIIAVLTLLSVSKAFGLAMLIWIILVVGMPYFWMDKLNTLNNNYATYGSGVVGKLVDSLTNILSIQLFSRTSKEISIAKDACMLAAQAEQKVEWCFFWIWLSAGLSFIILQAVNFYFLITQKKAGLITAGDFVIVIGINNSISQIIWDISKAFSQFSHLWGKITQSLEEINSIPSITEKAAALPLKVTHGEIIFNKVKFHYQGAPNIFEDKSITIPPGQKVGLVGYSGGGKSSFVNLILRLYDVSSGAILIDQQDIRDVTLASLRENIGMIPQDPALFHRSLLENIRYGKSKATNEEVYEAAKKAGADEFISKLANGYDSLVGERGVKLSGGQRQRIAIARAILKNAPILILDEATSQLDSITEKIIQNSLWQAMQGKTVIVIAHRLSTLLNMDRILVFEHGKIIEDGRHKELIVKGGLYKKLWDTQSDGFLTEE
jgi:ATP-binding cassette subfamily B protein